MKKFAAALLGAALLPAHGFGAGTGMGSEVLQWRPDS